MINFETLENIREELKKVELNESNQKTYSKVEALVNLAEDRLRSEYAVFLSDQEEQNISSYFTSIFQTIQNDISNPQAGHFRDILPHIQNALGVLKNIPDVHTEHTKQNLNQIISSFKSQITKQKTGYDQKVAALEQSIKQLENKLSQKETEVTNLTTAFQQQFSKAQENRIADYGKQISELKTQFEQKEKERESLFSQYEKARAQRDNNIETNLNKMYTSAEASAKTMLSHIRGIKDEAEKIFSLVGKTVLIGDKKVYADNARKRADRLFYCSVGLMIITAIIVIWPLLSKFAILVLPGNKEIDIANFDWWTLIPRIFVTLILLLPAFYLANESKKQRDQENKFRELEVKINAIDPYLLAVSTKDSNTIPLKDKVKLELAKELLGKDSNIDNNNNTVLPNDTFKLFDKIIDFVTKIKGI